MHRVLRLIVPAVIVVGTALDPAVATDVWRLDPAHSAAQFSVTHMMISTVRGEFGAMSGTIEYDGKDVASIKVEATIETATINTRNDDRDKDLKGEKFFDVAKYPTITFKSKKVVPGSGGAFKLVGDLTIHGTTKEVTLDVTAPSPVVKGMRGESRVGASAATKINRQDFGVSWNAALDGGGVVVSDGVAITIDIEAVLPPPAAPAAPAKK